MEKFILIARKMIKHNNHGHLSKEKNMPSISAIVSVIDSAEMYRENDTRRLCGCIITWNKNTQ